MLLMFSHINWIGAHPWTTSCWQIVSVHPTYGDLQMGPFQTPGDVSQIPKHIMHTLLEYSTDRAECVAMSQWNFNRFFSTSVTVNKLHYQYLIILYFNLKCTTPSLSPLDKHPQHHFPCIRITEEKSNDNVICFAIEEKELHLLVCL